MSNIEQECVCVCVCIGLHVYLLLFVCNRTRFILSMCVSTLNDNVEHFAKKIMREKPGRYTRRRGNIYHFILVHINTTTDKQHANESFVLHLPGVKVNNLWMLQL